MNLLKNLLKTDLIKDPSEIQVRNEANEFFDIFPGNYAAIRAYNQYTQSTIGTGNSRVIRGSTPMNIGDYLLTGTTTGPIPWFNSMLRSEL